MVRVMGLTTYQTLWQTLNQVTDRVQGQGHMKPQYLIVLEKNMLQVFNDTFMNKAHHYGSISHNIPPHWSPPKKALLRQRKDHALSRTGRGSISVENQWHYSLKSDSSK